MYTSTIIVKHDIEALEKLFLPEQKDLGRSSYKIRKDLKKHELIFEINADDATALKTVMNTLSKVFIVWEKTSVLTKDKD